MSRLVSIFIFSVVLIFSPPAKCEIVTVLQSTNDNINQSFVQIFRQIAATTIPSLTVKTITPANQKDLSAQLDAGTDIYLSVGSKASELLIQHNTRKPRLLVYISQEFIRNELSNNSQSCPPMLCQAIILDQPVERQLRLIKYAFPNINNVIILSSRKSTKAISQIDTAAKFLGLRIHSEHIESDKSLIRQLQDASNNNSVLLINPDQEIYNKNTARAVLLVSYRHKMPVFAYSQAFVNAGAAIGLYSTPEQIAKHATEQLLAIIKKQKNTSSTNLILPKYFTISLNPPVIESLGLTVPALDSLYKSLEN